MRGVPMRHIVRWCSRIANAFTFGALAGMVLHDLNQRGVRKRHAAAGRSRH